MGQRLPLLFMLRYWSQVTVHVETFFGKAKKLYQVVSSLVSMEGVQQVEFAASFSHHNQPKRTFDS